jgi:hypothetical protein
MLQLGPANEDDVVLAFLQAEIDSPRFGVCYQNRGLTSAHIRSLIEQADLQSPGENQLRKELLTLVRGYETRTALFQGFPQTVSWKKVAIEAGDAPKLLYANYPTWVDLSGGSRLILDGASRVPSAIYTAENAKQHIEAVAKDMAARKRYPALIAVERADGYLVIVEGHTRATAYVITGMTVPIELYVGVSPEMHLWTWY